MSARSARLRSIVLALGLVMASTLAARAQDDDPMLTAQARELFRQGLELADEAQWIDAADRFERALALVDSTVVRVNLSRSYLHLGRLVEADDLARSVLAADVDDGVAEAAREVREFARARVGRLRVVLRGGPDDARVSVSGRTVARDELPGPVAVDPGLHRVQVVQGERVLAEDEIRVAEDEEVEIELSVAGGLDEPGPFDPPPPPDRPSLARRWWLWALVGAVVAGAVVGAVVATR